MSNDIRSILERLAAVESNLTPVGVKHGLNKQQKSADQLPALFKPKNISPTLSKAPYQKHPMDGKLVGDSVIPRKSALEEAMEEIEEDMLSKVKKDLTMYLDKLDKKVSDDGQREKDTPELDKLAKKDKIDRDLIAKALSAVERRQAEESALEEDPTQQDTEVEAPPTPIQNPSLPETAAPDTQGGQGPSDPEDTEVAHAVGLDALGKLEAPQAPVQTMETAPGVVFEIHGNETQGFEIRHRGRSLPTRFPKLDHAKMAVDIFKSRRKQNQDLSQDYIEER